MKITLIINPHAGRNQPPLKKIEQVLKKHGVRTTFFLTKKRGDAKVYAMSAVREYPQSIVACGGDGTINEVINGMAGSNIPFGIVPCGTVNVLAMEMGIPANLEDAIELISKGKSQKIDLGLAGKTYFVLMAGMGFDAEVVKLTGKKTKKLFGASAYALTGIKSFKDFHPVKVRIVTDGRFFIRNTYLVVVSNSRFYAGKFSITPFADMKDGLLDVCIFEKKSALDLPRYALGVAMGMHHKLDGVEFFRAKDIFVQPLTERTISVQTDGEVIGTLPMHFSIFPKGLSIILPP